MNNLKRFFFAVLVLLAASYSHFSYSQDMMPEPEETVSLELGVRDTQEYGRNFGRDGNMSQLDVAFSAAPDLNHSLSWQVFDIERGEMSIFLNDEPIRTAQITVNNRLGDVDGITIVSADLAAGANVLSFRVTGGDETWGVTNLLVESIAATVPGEAATIILLDEPDQDGSAFGGRAITDFTFDFAERGAFYEESISITFDGFVAFGGVNGFELSLNGAVIGRVNNRVGDGDFIAQNIVLDKSDVREGQNTLRIRIITPGSGATSDAGFANLQVTTTSEPLLDVSVSELSVGEPDDSDRSVEITAVVDNIGARASLATTLTFSVSRTEDMSAPITLASAPVTALAGESNIVVVQTLEANDLRRGRFLRACIDRIAEDINAANDCSPVVELATRTAITAPAILLLLDD